MLADTDFQFLSQFRLSKVHPNPTPPPDLKTNTMFYSKFMLEHIINTLILFSFQQ